jgi:hypothetical protein
VFTFGESAMPVPPTLAAMSLMGHEETKTDPTSSASSRSVVTARSVVLDVVGPQLSD